MSAVNDILLSIQAKGRKMYVKIANAKVPKIFLLFALFFQLSFLGIYDLPAHISDISLVLGMLTVIPIILKSFIRGWITDCDKKPTNLGLLAFSFLSLIVSFVVMVISPLLVAWHFVIEPIVETFAKSIKKDLETEEPLRRDEYRRR